MTKSQRAQAVGAWEHVTRPKAQGPDEYYDPIGVRRMRVESGWLYQFETGCMTNSIGIVTGRQWGETVFVPSAIDTTETP